MNFVLIILAVCAFLFGAVGSWVFLFCYSRHRSRGYGLRITQPVFVNQIALSAEEIRIATKGFDGRNVIGSGRWSTVYRGVLRDGKNVAFKSLKLQEDSDEAQHNFLAECRTLGKLRHRNLVRILGYCTDPGMRILVLQYMPKGNLDTQLHDIRSLSWAKRLNILIDIAQAIVYLHHENGIGCVIHCDLKPSNIFLSEDFVAHVGDFGIARLIDPGTKGHATVSTYRGTMGYSPPEYAFAPQVTPRGDVYSYGVIVLEMLTGRHPTSDVFGEGVSLSRWVSSAFPERASEVLDPALKQEEAAGGYLQMLEAMKLGLICTQVVPKDRPTMETVLHMLLKVRNSDERGDGTATLVGSPSVALLGTRELRSNSSS